MRVDRFTIKVPETLHQAQGLIGKSMLVGLTVGVTIASFVFAEPSKSTPPDLRISAQVDKTAVDLGERLTLTITIEGNVPKARLEPFEFPDGWQVVAQRRASNLSFGLGRASRSTSLVYVLVAQQPGTFALGPFQIIHQGKTFLTDPIEVVVHKPVLPPTLDKQERFVL